MKTVQEILAENEIEGRAKAKQLPFPGFVEWFLGNFIDDLKEDESTMDVLSPILYNFYNDSI
jgi:hypothetical protein